MTDEAEEILFKKGVLSVPDFISNAGGVILGVVDVLGGKSDDVFKVVNNYIGPISRQILNESRQKNVNPRALAISKTTAKVLKARKQSAGEIDMIKLMDDLRKRLGL
jgi:glutamate dehydrogenase (NAD(P)+)